MSSPNVVRVRHVDTGTEAEVAAEDFDGLDAWVLVDGSLPAPEPEAEDKTETETEETPAAEPDSEVVGDRPGKRSK